MIRKTIFVTGPRIGEPENWNKVFEQVAAARQAGDVAVYHPGHYEHEDKYNSIRDRLKSIMGASEMHVMRLWENCQEAVFDVLLARKCGVPLYSAYDGQRITCEKAGELVDPENIVPSISDFSESILDEAKRITSGDRQSDYGPPSQDFARTAQMWSGILGAEVTREQVAMCMICVKLSRENYKPKRDNRVDMIGYALCLDGIVHKAEEQIK